MTGDKAQDRLLQLADKLFEYRSERAGVDAKEKAGLLGEIMVQVKEDAMAPLFEVLCQEGALELDSKLYKQMAKANAKELEQLDAAIEDAKENLGETEVFDALYNKAKFFARIGDKDETISKYEDVLEKSVGSGQRIDLVLDLVRVGFFWDDFALVAKYVAKAKELIEKGGDWERRNRLKVYEALYLMAKRDFSGAAELLLDSVATFTCTELCSYEKMVWYAILCATLTQPRSVLHEKVIKSPDIISIFGDLPHMETYVQSLYKCDYASFFPALVSIMYEGVRRDRFLSPHEDYYVREVRLVAYSQFLQSYRSVTLDAMARSFGVGQGYLDRDLSHYIAAGRIACKIDKVSGVVETNRPDTKNAQYQQFLRDGDRLLNRIHKLARVITY